METLKTQIDKHGRVVIPAAMRHAMRLQAGDTVVLSMKDHEISVRPPMSEVIQEAQKLVRRYIKTEGSLVEEFIKMRRDEAKLEDKVQQKQEDVRTNG